MTNPINFYKILDYFSYFIILFCGSHKELLEEFYPDYDNIFLLDSFEKINDSKEKIDHN